jgi:thiol-disulfide isomerase/thioredoxin
VTGCQQPADSDALATAAPPQATQAVAAEPVTVQPVTVQLLDFAGIERLVASHRGRVVVMDAWATSCPPCLQEFPKLVALSEKYPQDRLACISLSFDFQGLGKPEDKLPKVTAFLEKQNARFDHVLASEDADILFPKFKLASVPAVFVYDKSGALKHRFDNAKAASEAELYTYEDVERLVVELLDEAQPTDPAAGAEGAPSQRAQHIPGSRPQKSHAYGQAGMWLRT